MTLRAILLLLLVMLATGLLFTSCAKQESAASAVKGGLPSWPPDTMSVTLVGSGRLAIAASWKATGPQGRVHRLNYFQVVSNGIPHAMGSGVAQMTGVPDSSAEMLRKIIDRPRPWPSATAVVLASWPQDTTASWPQDTIKK